MLSNILNNCYEYIEQNEEGIITNEMNIYPVIIEDYSKFQNLTRLLYICKDNFTENEIPLLDLIVLYLISDETTDEQLEINRKLRTDELCKLFSLIIKKQFKYKRENEVTEFISDDGKSIINCNNYDGIRQLIMYQNLMFEQKIYKNKLVAEWAEATLKAKMKNQPKIGMEEMLTTISVKAHKHYWDLNKYSIYQIYSDFYRIRKDKNYDTGVMAQMQGGTNEVEDFAEQLDLYKNPYDSVFVDDKKMGGLESVCGGN